MITTASITPKTLLTGYGYYLLTKRLKRQPLVTKILKTSHLYSYLSYIIASFHPVTSQPQLSVMTTVN